MPALSAGPPANTPPWPDTYAPFSAFISSCFAILGVKETERTPKNGLTSLPWSFTLFTRPLTSLIGMAKPMPWAPSATAVFIPMTSPEILTSGPPELPGLMAASVWKRFVSCSVAPPPSPAVIGRPQARDNPGCYSVLELPQSITHGNRPLAYTHL